MDAQIEAQPATTPSASEAAAALLARPETRLFVALVAVFVSCLLLGDVVGGKLMTTPFGPISVGMLPFPVTFLLTDVVNDFYGRRGARFMTLVGFFMASLAFAVLQITTWLPVDPTTYFGQPEFAKIFGGSSSIFVASMCAYLIGQYLDIQVFQFWKALTESKHLWLRATGSTILSQIIDTATINAILGRFMAHWSWGFIAAKSGREYVIKLVVAVLLTPFVYILHEAIVRGLRMKPEAHEVRSRIA